MPELGDLLGRRDPAVVHKEMEDKGHVRCGGGAEDRSFTRRTARKRDIDLIAVACFDHGQQFLLRRRFDPAKDGLGGASLVFAAEGGSGGVDRSVAGDQREPTNPVVTWRQDGQRG